MTEQSKDAPIAPVVRPLDFAWLPDCLRLSRAAGWNQTAADWRLFLKMPDSGLLGAFAGKQLIGTAAHAGYDGRLAWIGMVLVDPAFRGRGIGQSLMQAVLARVQAFPYVGLDATPAGRPLYARLGFSGTEKILRLVRHVNAARLPAGEPLPPPDEVARQWALEWDGGIVGARRRDLLGFLFESAPELACMKALDGHPVAVCFGRPGLKYTQIGPVVAHSFEAAQAVVLAALQPLAGAAMIDVPATQPAMAGWLQTLGFVQARSFTRMYRGPKPGLRLSGGYAVAGPEFG